MFPRSMSNYAGGKLLGFGSPYKTQRRHGVDGKSIGSTLTAVGIVLLGVGAASGLACYFVGNAAYNYITTHKIVKIEEDHATQDQKKLGR
jgi:hypothetical protein